MNRHNHPPGALFLENLFQPGTGVVPPFLAGREEEERLCHRLFRTLQRGQHPPAHIVAFGPRGNGKTALLRVMEQHARQAGLHTLWLSAPALQSQDCFVEAILRETLKRSRKPAGQPLLEGVKNLIQWLQVDFALGTWKAGVRLEDPALRRRLQGTTVRDLLDIAIGGREYQSREPLVLFIDEAHQMDPALGHVLLNDAQLLIGEQLPFLLVLAGTPQLERRLQAMQATFWERSEILPVGRLSVVATEAALVRPLAEHHIQFEPAALDTVTEEAQGYPYFIQLWGQALCARLTVASGRLITPQHVAQAGRDFHPRKNRFYGRRYQEIEKSDLLPLARTVARWVLHYQTGKTPCSIYHLKESLKANTDFPPQTITDGLETLEALGFIWSPDASTVEPGIPGLMQHTLEQGTPPSPPADPAPASPKP